VPILFSKLPILFCKVPISFFNELFSYSSRLLIVNCSTTYSSCFKLEALMLSLSSFVTVLKIISYLVAFSCMLATVTLNSWNSKYMLIYLLMSLLSLSIFLPSFTRSLKSFSDSFSFFSSIKNLMTMNSWTSSLMKPSIIN